MTQATSNNYWISPNALYIELNALGNPDYIQASCVSGAQILVYVTGIVSYDAGHNYRRWSLQTAPTVFNDHKAKYVYAAIPRDMSSTKSATIVFPSEQIDIYGKNASETQIGSEEYYYIFLQGIISTSGDNGTTNRNWTQRISTGYLSSDEAIDASNKESEWYKYSSVDGITTFLKDLTMKAGTKFHDLFTKSIQIVSGGSLSFEGQGEMTGIATKDTDLSSTQHIVTPKYMDDNALSSKHDDVSQGLITFLKGIALGADGKCRISEAGAAVLKSVVVDLLQSADYDAAEESGFGFYKRADGKYGLNITDVLVWGKAIFNNLEIRNLYSVGGSIVLSPSSGKIVKVAEVTDADTGAVTGWKCWMLADDGTMATTNQWQVGDQARCQTFNVAAGIYEHVSNKDYWRRVISVSAENEVITDASGTVLYDGKKFAWVVLSKTDCMEGSDEPQADDTIVCMGSRTVTDRQHLIMLATEGDDAPSLTLYRGVNSYTLTGKKIFHVSYNGIEAVSQYFKWTDSSGAKVWTPTYLGTWQDGREYGYYDEVTWMGTRWLCVAPEGTAVTEEPSEDSSCWMAETAIVKPKLVLYHDLGAGISLGETHTITCRGMMGDQDITSTLTGWAVTRSTGDSVEDAAWLTRSKVKAFDGTFALTWVLDVSESDMGNGETAVFTFSAKRPSGETLSESIGITT